MKSTALGLSRRAEGERRLWRPSVAARPADPEHIDGFDWKPSMSLRSTTLKVSSFSIISTVFEDFIEDKTPLRNHQSARQGRNDSWSEVYILKVVAHITVFVPYVSSTVPHRARV